MEKTLEELSYVEAKRIVRAKRLWVKVLGPEAIKAAARDIVENHLYDVVGGNVAAFIGLHKAQLPGIDESDYDNWYETAISELLVEQICTVLSDYC